jgi:hypothetical protein
LVLQDIAPLSEHCPSGSIPAGTLMQLPALPPGSPQDLQLPVQVVAQQAPCAQIPELQSTSIAQLAPIGFLPQLPLLQVVGAMQSASTVQVVLHWPVAPQT